MGRVFVLVVPGIHYLERQKRTLVDTGPKTHKVYV